MKLYVLYSSFGGHGFSEPHRITISLEEANEWKEQHYSHLYEEFTVDGLFQVLDDIIDFPLDRSISSK